MLLRLARIAGIMLGMFVMSGGGVLHGQAVADSLEAELVRSRGFIRGAETQLTKVLDLFSRLPPPAGQIDTLIVTDTVEVPVVHVDTVEVIRWDTVQVTDTLTVERVDTIRETVEVVRWDTVTVVDTLYLPAPDSIPDPSESPDTAATPTNRADVSDLSLWDEVGSATTVERADTAWRVVMGAGGYTYIRLYTSLSAGSWRVVVTHSGTGGCFRFGVEAFAFTDLSEPVTQMFYRQMAEPGSPVLEIDNCNETMDRTFYSVVVEEVIPAQVAEQAIALPSLFTLQPGEQETACLALGVEGGGYLLDLDDMFDPICQQRFQAWRADPTSLAP